MYEALFRHGGFYSPYYIFVRGEGRYSDTDLLRLFGLPTYQPTRSPRRFGRYAILADDGPWNMIADDMHYTLCNMTSRRPVLEELGKACDVFAGWVGDSDYSVDLLYYSAGQLARRLVVTDHDYRGGKIVENVGEPLPGETAELIAVASGRTVPDIAASLGIKTDYAPRDVRVYAPPA